MADPSPEWSIYIPLVSSLAGAGVGAWTAQLIAARNKRNDEKMKEVRAAQAATTIAYGITDHFISMKQQIVKPLKDDFDAMRARFREADIKPKPPGGVRFNVPLDAFRFNVSPHKELQDIVLKELSAPIRLVMMVPILTRTLTMLDKIAEDRNAMVKEIQEKQKAGKEMDPYAYYGIPYPTGGADARYANSVEHISDYTDDVIAFSNMIGDDLRAYALALRDTLPKQMRALAPRITTMSFDHVELMPGAARYQTYDTLIRPLRTLGAGVWTAEFEALALSQYQTEQEHWVS